MFISYLEPTEKYWDENHLLTNALRRYSVSKGKYHIAVHDFSVVEDITEYSMPHSHMDEDEINIIFSNEKFRIKIEIDSEYEFITKNCVISIPAGVRHSANVQSGCGIFICIRIPQ